MYLSSSSQPKRTQAPIATIRGPRGMGKYLGFGDVNSDAQAKYTAAGYKGVTCAPQVITYPGGSYTLNQCNDAQGVTMSADAAAGLTPQQLQTQLANETSFNSGNADAEIMALTKNAGGGGVPQYPFGAPSSVNQTWLYTGRQPTTILPTPAPATTTPTSSSTSSSSSSSSSGGLAPKVILVDSAAPAVASGIDLGFLSSSISILGFNVPVWALGGGLLLAPFLFGGRR